MALVIDKPAVQVWLEPTKTRIETTPTEQMQHVQDRVFAWMRRVFDEVDQWVTPEATPLLIRNAIAMWTAGLVFNKHYAQQSTSFAAYGNMLISDAKSLLQDLEDGVIVLEEEPVRAEKMLPAFWPSSSEGRKFSMDVKL